MTINELITPELRDAWQIANRFPKPSPLGVMCNGIRDLLAALLESEFKLEHVVKEHDSPITGKYSMCGICPMELDPRHLSTWPDWQAEATRILEGE